MLKKITLLLYITIFISCTNKSYEEIKKDGYTIIKNKNSEKVLDFKVEKSKDIPLSNYLSNILSYTITNSGSIYILEKDDNKIYIFNSSGEFMSSFGNRGGGPGEFIAPVGIFSSPDHIYVPDILSKKVSLFDLDGNFIKDYTNLSSLPISNQLFKDTLFVGFIMNQKIIEGKLNINRDLTVKDLDLNPIKTVLSTTKNVDINNMFSNKNDEPIFCVGKSMIYIESCSESEVKIEVYDSNGVKRKIIEKSYKKIPYLDDEIEKKNQEIKKKLKGGFGEIKFDRKFKKSVYEIHEDKLLRIWVKEALLGKPSTENSYLIFNKKGILEGRANLEIEGEIVFKNEKIYLFDKENLMLKILDY
ncbi:MAG: hypothetical protein CSA15_11195 [Candidatus Delongbacteria bacterium]|nr:MAG: hypothetical protein CSA15_11195 [Candidatus Delongbacteria bacterium]